MSSESLNTLKYFTSSSVSPLFIEGDALRTLVSWPSACVDFVMTSPPYWGQREYANGGVGLEKNPEAYINSLLTIFAELHRVLKPTGSFWLNVGDVYLNKCLLNIPWRLAIRMVDEQKWCLRNTVIWHKVKGGPDSSQDKLRNVYEPLFHFVKKPRGYYYDVDSIRHTPGETKVVNGKIVSATGVSGVRYRRQLELSTSLSESEKTVGVKALDSMLDAVRKGEFSDFRMIIRGQQRVTHSDSLRISGRAKELKDKGFYFLRYHPKGAKPTDVWDVIPEDTQKRKEHFAPYPEDLCRVPLLATCPEGGIVLDPFCGTGTTLLVAHELRRKSVGIDISGKYIASARERCRGGRHIHESS